MRSEMLTVTPCGSAKFKDLIHEVSDGLVSAGFVVFRPPLHEMAFAVNLAPESSLLAWKGATYAHLQRVAKADICMVINPGGYVGAGATLELGFAVGLRKVIVFLQPDSEPARYGLADFTLETENAAEAVRAMKRIFQIK
jgi:hypothetical protein